MVTLITGANGEIGHSLIDTLSEVSNRSIIALDQKPLGENLVSSCTEVIIGDILDENLLKRLEHYHIDEIYHLAAVLSTQAEDNPERAYKINVQGTLGLLHMATRIGTHYKHPVTFLFPSSIAVYGIRSLADKNTAGAVPEDEYNCPQTIYGITKLCCEQIGCYYSESYKRLSPDSDKRYVDFRALRFPGLLSAFTLPSGGTSDYAPEMVHAAARGRPYSCFVRKQTKIPFMVMSDAVKGLFQLAAASPEVLSRRVYNVGAFSLEAGEIARLVNNSFPNTGITFQPDEKRNAIVDTWPSAVDDSAARIDWNWRPDYNLKRAFEEYLIPNISRYYAEH